MRRQRRPAGCRRAGDHAAAAATAGNAGVSGSGSGAGSGAGSVAQGRRMAQHGAVLKLERPPARSFLCLFWQLAPPYHIDLHPALSKPTAIGKPAGML